MDGVRINGDSGSVDTGTRGREFMIAHTSAMKVVNTSCVKSFSSSAYKHRVKYLSSGTNYSFLGSTHVGGMWRVEFPHRSRVVQLILEGSIFDVDSVNRQIVYKVCTSIFTLPLTKINLMTAFQGLEILLGRPKPRAF